MNFQWKCVRVLKQSSQTYFCELKLVLCCGWHNSIKIPSKSKESTKRLLIPSPVIGGDGFAVNARALFLVVVVPVLFKIS